MTEQDRKSPRKTANDLQVILQATLGEDRFGLDVGELAIEYTRIFDDPITKVVGDDLSDCEGTLQPSAKKPQWYILFNKTPRYPGRERFTLAHELGHYLLHRSPLDAADFEGPPDPAQFEERTFSCTPLERHEWKTEHEVREEEADTFASYLLMPMDDYRSQIAGAEMSLELLRHVAKRYGVSFTAVVRKWIEFTDKRAAMVVGRDGFALWGRASDAAYGTGIFVRSGMPIPNMSIAGRGPEAQNGEKNLPIALPKGIWCFKNGSEPVRELTIFSEKLGQSISLLLFNDPEPRYSGYEPRVWDSYDQFQWRG